MTTGYRFTLGAHTVVDRLGHFRWQVDLLDAHINHFDAQRRHTVRVDHRHFTVGFSLNTFSRFGNRIVCRRGFNFILGARRAGVQRITHFQRQTTTGVGHNVFHIQTTNFRTQTVRELTFQQHFCLRNVATPGCQEVAAEIADAPFDIGINDQVFLLFSHETIGLVIHGLDTRIERFH